MNFAGGFFEALWTWLEAEACWGAVRVLTAQEPALRTPRRGHASFAAQEDLFEEKKLIKIK